MEFRRYGDTAGNGSALENFLHHGLLSRDGAEFIDAVDVVVVRDEAGLMGVAVLADVYRRARETVVVTLGLVDRAGLISNVVVVHPLEGTEGLTTVAALVIHGAGEENLGGEVHIGPGSLSADLDSIG